MQFTLILETKAFMSTILLIFVGLFGVFGLYFLIGSIAKSVQRNKFKRQGKTIAWSTALSQTQAGEGVFVIHQKMLWWLAKEPPDKGVELYIETEKNGLLVQSHPKGNLSDLLTKYAPGRFRTVRNIPFIDPE